MTALERLMPQPDLVEVQAVDVAAPPDEAWAAARAISPAGSRAARALFALRTLPSRLRGGPPMEPFGIDDLVSSPESPGFQVLVDDPPREVVVGAVGPVWRREIPFVHIDGADAFAAYDEPGQVKVAWGVRVLPAPGGAGATIVAEVRVAATDEDALRRFRRYFRVIGPFSRLIRRGALDDLSRRLGRADPPMPGDDLLPDAAARTTHAACLAATAEAVWPWLVQMGRGRAGFYSIDLLDNGGARSARELHPELGDLSVGDVVPALPRGDEGFEVLRADAPRALVLGGLWDAEAGRQRPFGAPRPERFWHVTWAFSLEPLGGGATRLRARAAAAYPPGGRLHAAWARPVHHVMQSAQLRNLAARAEGRVPATDWRDVAAGIGGAGRMGLALVSPMARGSRERWGATPELLERTHPGDDLVPEPRWGWTHAVEVAAPAARVWPWVAQIGADRAGFYSYSWLENLVGCAVRDAERIHPEWELHEGDELRLHPSAPPLRVVEAVPGHHLLAFGAPDEDARRAGRPWVAASWLFVVEEEPDGPTRVVSRYRCATSDDLRTRLAFGPAVVEPIGSTMDRRMLLGIRRRAEHSPRRPARI